MVQLAAQAASAHTFNEAALQQTLQAIAQRSRATDEDIERFLEEGFEQGVAQAMADGIITRDDEQRLRAFRDRLALKNSAADQGALAELDRAGTDRVVMEVRLAAISVQNGDGHLRDLTLSIRQAGLGSGGFGTLEAGRSSENPPRPETRRQSSLRAPAEKADGKDRMYHNRAASYIWVCLGETLTATYQAEAIRRLADALGMTVVREYEDEECGRSPGDRPQFQRMMEEVRSEPKPFGAIIAYDRVRFAASAANLGEVRQGAPGRRSRAALRVGQAAKERHKDPDSRRSRTA